MATPFIAATQKKDLGPLDSADDVGGGGAPAPGQQFSDAKGSTDFVNADKLLSANAGKGQSMLDNATANQVDTTADFSDLNTVKNYNPDANLSTTTSSNTATKDNVGKDASGNTTKWTTTSITPTTTTSYNGLSTDDIDAKKANIDALKSKFNDLGNTFADSPSGVNLRQVAQQKAVASTVPTYSAQQGGFDSFLMENEGNKAGADGTSSIQNRRANIDALKTKFDGIDDTTANVKTGIQAAQGKVGTVAGNTLDTNSAVLTTPTVTDQAGAPDPAKAAAVAGGFQITGKDGSISYYNKAGDLITKVAQPDSSKSVAEPNGGFAIKSADGTTSHYDKNGNFLSKS